MGSSGLSDSITTARPVPDEPDDLDRELQACAARAASEVDHHVRRIELHQKNAWMLRSHLE